MRLNRVFATLLLILLFCAGFAHSVSAENRVDRPWDRYGWEKERACLFDGKTPCYPNYHYVLDSLNLSEIAINYEKANSKMEEALDSKRTADEKYDDVGTRLANFKHAIELDDTLSRCIGGGIIGAVAGPFAMILAPAGAIIGCVGGAALPYLGYSELENAVKDYNPYWTGTMDPAMDALELSAQNATDSVADARQVYEELKDAGLCDAAYTWQAGGKCRQMESAFAIVDSEAEEATYGKLNTMRKNIVLLNDQLEEPNATLYYPTMVLIWGEGDEKGIVQVFNELKQNGLDAKKEADDYYKHLKSDADIEKTAAAAGNSELRREELEKITEAVPVSISEVAETPSGTIAQRYKNYETAVESADAEYKWAESAHNIGGENYLLMETAAMETAKTLYDSLEDSDELLDDAEIVVDARKEEAEQAIENAESRIESGGLGEEANAALEAAKEKLEEADNAGSLGAQYLLYIEAAEMANSVTGKTAEQDMAYEALLAEVKKLAGDAGSCGKISVAGWQAEIEYIETNEPATAASRLNQIKSEIENAMQLKYSYLEEKRAELNEKLAAAEADDLLEEMREAEAGVVANGRINYLAVCSVATLANAYDEIEESLEEDETKANDALANQLIVETSLLIEPVVIDGQTDIAYVVTVVNPKNYGGEEVEVTVPLEGDFNFMYSNIVSDTSDVLSVRTEGKKLRILFTEIGPLERKTVSFEKTAILATARSRETVAVGLGDGSAEVDEKTVFKLDVADVRVAISEDSTSILIDNLDPTRPLSEGIHTMTRRYTVDDAYTETRTDATTSASITSATVSYSITIEPDIDLDEVPVIADIGSETYVTNVMISCGAHDCVEENKAGTYIITVYDLAEGQDATVAVSYATNNPPDYIEEELAKYESSQEPEIQQLVLETKSLLSAGRYDEALKKLEEVKKKSAELEKEKSKLLKQYYDLVRKVNNELEDLNDSMAKANQLGIGNNTEVRKLQTRKAMLEAELNGTSISTNSSKDDIQAAIDDLKAIDMNWLKSEVDAVSKQAKKDFESFKKEFVEYDNATASSMLKQLEDDINVLLATEKATDMVTVLADVENINRMKTELASQREAELAQLQADFEGLKENAEEVLQRYEKQYKDAKDLAMDSLFPIQPNSVRSLLSNAEKSIEDGDVRNAEQKIEKDIPAAVKKMEDTLKLLSANAYRKLDEVDELLATKKGELSGEQIAEIERKESSVESLAAAGDYVKAINEANKLISYINGMKGKGNMALYLIIASLLLVALVVIYMMRQKKKKQDIKPLEKEKKDW